MTPEVLFALMVGVVVFNFVNVLGQPWINAAPDGKK